MSSAEQNQTVETKEAVQHSNTIQEEDALKAKEQVQQNVLLSSATRQAEQMIEEPSTPVSASPSTTFPESPFTSSSKLLATPSSTSSPSPSPKKKPTKGVSKVNRCSNSSCKKKIGLLGMACKCEKVFCSLCRYPDAHSCKFNFKQHGQDKLRKENQQVVAAKVSKI